MSMENYSAEAFRLSIEALKRHISEKMSLKSSLYAAARGRRVRTQALRLARRMLHLYAVKRHRVRKILREFLGDVDLREEEQLMLELILLAAIEKMNLGDLEEFARRLRVKIGEEKMRGIEPYLGVLRGLQLIEIGEVEESYPRWLIRYVSRLLGRHEAKNLLRFQDSEKPPLYISLNTLILPSEKILHYLEERGLRLVRDERIGDVFILEEAENVRELSEAVKAGLISIHDISSYYAALGLGVKPGDKILDVCAAPGVKTWILAKLMKNRGRIISIDSSAQRLQSHLRRMSQMRVRIAEDIVVDATHPLPLRNDFDGVLVDPPCSSTGLLWREPSYRWRIKPRHVKMFARLQLKILENASRHVKVNGYLLYSTCSITLEENEFIVEDFLKRNPEFSLVEISPALGRGGKRGLRECRRLYPHSDRCNGFFLAKFLRRW